MTGLGKVWMGLHRQLKLEWRWAGAGRTFGVVRKLRGSWLWTGSRWSSIFPWAFPPWGIPPLLEFAQVERFHFDLLECSLSFISMDDPEPLRQACWTCAVSSVGRTWSSAGCYPACSGALGPAPFLSWPVRSCRLLLTVNQAQTCQIMQCYTQSQELGWDLQIHFHMQLKPRSFSQAGSGVEKKWDAKGQTYWRGG